jgi:aryl-alcohol dehydrogenase-like predicted oxidoreductase
MPHIEDTMDKIFARLGIGLYHLPHDHAPQLLAKAVELGSTYFDGAASYQGGKAHEILCHLAHTFPGKISASTKICFISTTDEPNTLDSTQCVQGMCLDPLFFQTHVERLATELQGVHLKTVFVHNPDIHSERLGKKGLLDTLAPIFDILEQGVNKGLFEDYGIATYTGFDKKDLDLKELVNVAQNVAGPDHHFKAIQLPLNLISISPLFEAYHHHAGVLMQAHHMGIKVHASATLAGGQLPKIVGPELAQWIRPGCSPAAACWLVVASCPFVDVMLTSPSCPTHLEEYATLSHLPALSVEEMERITYTLMKGKIEH